MRRACPLGAISGLVHRNKPRARGRVLVCTRKGYGREVDREYPRPIIAPVDRTLPIRRRSSRLRGGEAEHVAAIDLDHGVEAGGVRLSHAPKSGFGQFNHAIIMDDEIQAGVEEKAAGHDFG